MTVMPKPLTAPGSLPSLAKAVPTTAPEITKTFRTFVASGRPSRPMLRVSAKSMMPFAGLSIWMKPTPRYE